jgi:protein-S-isoprenylcysteine O-methyltransferase Ste14
MPEKKARSDPYAARGRSAAQRVVLTTALGVSVAAAWWLLLGGGIAVAGAWVGRFWHADSWQPGDAARRLCLGVALTIYFVRLLFTQFVFLRRAMSWGEACLIAVWVACIYIVLAMAGGTNPAPLRVAGAAGAGLFVLGSWMNSYAEYERHVWKQRAENRGRLYTLGLFRYSRHPNYLGDLISFSGFCLMAGRWETFAIPAMMLAGFVFANIPMLDAHLHDHYGAAFDEYAARTRKLIPFVY